MPNFHPIVVHFPIALLTIGFLFDLIARFGRNAEFSRLGWWLQATGTIALATAVTTGLLAKSTVAYLPLARDYFEMHEQIALVVSVGFALLLYWRVSSKSRVPARYETLYLLLMGGSILLLWAGAWYGGEMVYRFGVGVRP